MLCLKAIHNNSAALNSHATKWNQRISHVIQTLNVMRSELNQISLFPGQKNHWWLRHPHLDFTFGIGGYRHPWHLHTGNCTVTATAAVEVHFYYSSNKWVPFLSTLTLFLFTCRNSMCRRVSQSPPLTKEAGSSVPLAIRSLFPPGWWEHLLYLPFSSSSSFSWKLRSLRAYCTV